MVRPGAHESAVHGRAKADRGINCFEPIMSLLELYQKCQSRK